MVRKRSGEIRLCVDFRNLNKCFKKDNYPLPKMKHLLQKVSGAKVMSFMDGFQGTTKFLYIQMTKKILLSPLHGAHSCSLRFPLD